MFILVGITFLLLNLILHEAAHAIAMRKYGVEIKKAGIGFPIKPYLTIRGFFSFPLTISPFLLGAYVEPTLDGEEKIKSLPYRDRAVIFGVGVIANLLVALVMIGIFFINEGNIANPLLYGFLAAGVVTGFALVKLARLLCGFVIPVIGLAALVLTVYSVAISNPLSQEETQALVGPIGIVGMILGSTTFEDILEISFVISIGIALVNMLPIFPFDGGRIAEAIMQKFFGERVASVFKNFSYGLIILLIIVAFAGDIAHLR